MIMIAMMMEAISAFVTSIIFYQPIPRYTPEHIVISFCIILLRPTSLGELVYAKFYSPSTSGVLIDNPVLCRE
jgi:hypothetical protein